MRSHDDVCQWRKRFASECSSFGHGSLGQSTLVGGPGVADKLRKAGVAGRALNEATQSLIPVCGAAAWPLATRAQTMPVIGFIAAEAYGDA
jgi:hypothetical protein